MTDRENVVGSRTSRPSPVSHGWLRDGIRGASPPHSSLPKSACSRADRPTQCSSHQYMFSHSLSEKLGLKSAPSADSVALKRFLLVGTGEIASCGFGPRAAGEPHI